MSNEYIWTSAGTDITVRWRIQHGWVPPSELPHYQEKWKQFQELPLRKLDHAAQVAYEEAMARQGVKNWGGV